MKKFFPEFFKRGFLAASGGPIVLAIIYFIVGKTGAVENLTTNEVALGIISTTFMAYIAGGITAIYQNEKLPTVSSALIHAAVLYLDYLIMYLVNDWGTNIGIFTVSFAIGFALIWLIVYLIIRNQAKELNALRTEKQ